MKNQSFLQFLIPDDVSEPSPWKRWRIYTIFITISFGFLFALGVMASQIYQDRFGLETGVIVTLAGFAYILPMLIKFTGRIKLPVFIFLLFDGLLFAYSSLSQGGIQASAIYWLVPFLAYTTILSGRRYGLITFVFYSLIFLYFAFQNLESPPLEEQGKFYHLIRLGYIISTIQLVFFFWATPTNRARYLLGSALLLALIGFYIWGSFQYGLSLPFMGIFVALGFYYFGKFRLIVALISLILIGSSFYWAPGVNYPQVQEHWLQLHLIMIAILGFTFWLCSRVLLEMPKAFTQSPTLELEEIGEPT